VDACTGRRLLHKPLIYPVRYDEVQRVYFAGGQKSHKDPSIAARRPYRAPADKSRDTRVEILQRPHLCATASMDRRSERPRPLGRFPNSPRTGDAIGWGARTVGGVRPWSTNPAPQDPPTLGGSPSNVAHSRHRPWRRAPRVARLLLPGTRALPGQSCSLPTIFGRRDLSGWGKAGWTLLIFILPLIGIVAYLVARPAEAPRGRSTARGYQEPVTPPGESASR
jgi:hypothetical protein